MYPKGSNNYRYVERFLATGFILDKDILTEDIHCKEKPDKVGHRLEISL
jgi:hypothetical protein